MAYVHGDTQNITTYFTISSTYDTPRYIGKDKSTRKLITFLKVVGS